MPELNSILVPYSEKWILDYQEEAEKIKNVFGNNYIDIQHIGSTSIPNMLSKPIIDVAVLIASSENANDFIAPLEKLGYVYKPEISSPERHFFKKGSPTKYHLSIAYTDKGSYWKRQILFRDYLIQHDEARKEYEQYKLNLLREDATIDRSYKGNKEEFVQKILSLAEKSENTK
ncbi:MAG: GrpB family protein [Candidatus Pacebacteria bacterium]|nr:GrpB family protein [Candidatus Paceibacterota bacterium]